MKKQPMILLAAACFFCGLLSGCAQQTMEETTVPNETSTEAAQIIFTAGETEIPVQTETNVQMVTFTDSTVQLTQKGETKEIYCGPAEMEEVSWYSEDETVAILARGSVIAVGDGTTTVWARYRQQEVSCQVTCRIDPDAPVLQAPQELIHSPRLAPPCEEPQDLGFFDDAVILGDSVSYTLFMWNNIHKKLGNAIFLTRGSFGLDNSVANGFSLYYQGVEYAVEDAVAAVHAKKILVMLGTNDLARFGPEGTVALWDAFLEKILARNPGLEIYIQSCTPVHPDSDYTVLGNQVMDEYNALLKAYCREKGYYFIHIAPYFKDFTNCLVDGYCSDQYVHLSFQGAEVWAKALLAYAAGALPE